MPLPFFYIEDAIATAGTLQLNEDNSKHIVQVLRMKIKELLQLTDGKGNLFTCEIADDHKKKCVVQIINTTKTPAPQKKITIAISLVKNNTRFEWFLEKATEIGVTAIVPLLCERTEKQHVRTDRMHGILISAMLQSQQIWLPTLSEPLKYNTYLKTCDHTQKFIAHCAEEKNKVNLISQINENGGNKIILIGPEGDFTKAEIDLALQNNFTSVSLGATRLRTETAAMVAATFLCNI